MIHGSLDVHDTHPGLRGYIYFFTFLFVHGIFNAIHVCPFYYNHAVRGYPMYVVKGKNDIEDNHICQRTTNSQVSHISEAKSSPTYHKVPNSLKHSNKLITRSNHQLSPKFCRVTRNTHRIALLTQRDYTHRFYPVSAACTE